MGSRGREKSKKKMWLLHVLESTKSFDLVTSVEFIMSLILGMVGLLGSLSLKSREYLRGWWYRSLHYIMGLLAIAGLSNAWTVLLIGDKLNTKPTELLLHLSLLIIAGWVWAFYKSNLSKPSPNGSGSTSTEKIIRFISEEAKCKGASSPKSTAKKSRKNKQI